MQLKNYYGVKCFPLKHLKAYIIRANIENKRKK